MTRLLRALPFVLLIFVAACADMKSKPSETAPPAPAAPQITEDMLRTRANEQLAAAVKLYDAGEYDSASRSFNASLEHGLLPKVDQARARKYLAFIYCVLGREAQCRDEFRRAFEIYPDFSLTSAEDGHPIWGPVYRNVRTQLITEREANQQQRTAGIMASKGELLLRDGLIKYDSGDYEGALKQLEAAQKEGLKDRGDQVRALKYTAFSLCLKERWPQCRATFVKIYDINPDFDLTLAEAGHPSWSKTFAQAKAQAKKNLADKDKATSPPAAAVPPKKN
jgi:tetratricopeptide (TPR) repeat protein